MSYRKRLVSIYVVGHNMSIWQLEYPIETKKLFSAIFREIQYSYKQLLVQDDGIDGTFQTNKAYWNYKQLAIDYVL